MGIDSATLYITTKDMFDQKAQSFLNIWFPNQVAEQNMMNFAVSNLTDRAQMPMGFDALPDQIEFLDSGNTPTSHLPSGSRSYSTDNSNDPTPDGPGIEYGNGNCHSPRSNSVCFTPTEFDEEQRYTSPMGTPNSFVTEQMPMSPDMFRDSGSRQRQFSTNSSTFTYSPYNAREEEFSPIAEACTSPPALNRQTSLAIVEEVLGVSDDCNQPLHLFSCEDSPSLAGDDDSCLPAYPSPSFSAHFNANKDLAHAMPLSSSQRVEFYEQFYNSEAPGALQCAGSPVATESNGDCNCSNEGSQNEQESCSQEVSVSVENAQPSTLLPLPTMSRQPSNFSDIFNDSMPSNSLDTHEMLQDCLNALPVVADSSQVTYKTLNIKVISIKTNPRPAQVIRVEPEESPKPKDNEDSTSLLHTIEYDGPTSSVDKSAKEVTAIARRDRNNEACRQSRKRRKSKKQESESEAVRLCVENGELVVKIDELEIECKRMKQSIIEAMTNNNSH